MSLYCSRRELLYANINLSESDTAGQVTLYQDNVDSISETIAKYDKKIEKLDNKDEVYDLKSSNAIGHSNKNSFVTKEMANINSYIAIAMAI